MASVLRGSGDSSFGGNLSIEGVLTYEDVSSVDSVGIVTARSGLHVGTGASIFSPDTNELALGTNNTQRLTVSSGGNIGVNTTTFPVNGTNLKVSDGTISRLALDKTGTNARQFEIGNLGTGLNIYDLTADAERLRIDSSGRMLIGASSSANVTRLGQALAVVTTSDFGGASLTGFTGSTNYEGPVLDIQRSRGTSTVGTVVEDNDRIGSIVFRADDGTDFADAAYILGEVDGTPNGGYVPGRFAFYTSTNSVGPTERMRIDSAGNMGLGKSSNLFYRLTFQEGAGDANRIGWVSTSGNRKASIDCGNTAAIVFNTGVGDTERMRIDSSGRVVKNNQPGFLARRTVSGDGRAAGAQEWTVSGTASFNTGNHFNTSNGRFTAPVAGRYLFIAQPGYKQTGQDYNFYFYINGAKESELVRFIDGGDDLVSHSAAGGSVVYNLAANDYVYVYVNQTHHANTTYNYFCGYLLG